MKGRPGRLSFKKVNSFCGRGLLVTGRGGGDRPSPSWDRELGGDAAALSPASGRSTGVRRGPEAARGLSNLSTAGPRAPGAPLRGRGVATPGRGARWPLGSTRCTDAAARPPASQALAPRPGKCILVSAVFCSLEGPSLLGSDSPSLTFTTTPHPTPSQTKPPQGILAASVCQQPLWLPARPLWGIAALAEVADKGVRAGGGGVGGGWPGRQWSSEQKALEDGFLPSVFLMAFSNFS